MRSKQRGMSLTALLAGGFVVIILSLLGMKLVPALIEYQTVKKAVYAIATEGSPTVADVRRSFNARATIDDIEVVKASDLEITKDGNQIVIGFAYRKEVPLFFNIGVYMDFKADSRMRDR